MRLKLLLALLCSFVFAFVQAQNDSIVKTDNLKKAAVDTLVKDTAKKHSVARAALFSAVLPGLGQAYNKKWWKIPIVYAALGATGYFLISNQIKQKEAKDQINRRIDDPTYQFEGRYEGLDSLGVLTLQRDYQNSRDLFIFLTAGVYLLNILDAAVDAQLYNFDVSRDLSLRWSPVASPRSIGLGFQLQIKPRRKPTKFKKFNLLQTASP